eukprot:maker-scaffold1595_size34508-snap-gene-0.7 protein:Tk09497 transcript:maker-scaffold1595_size34508-snap-gene-0.7-mRNA-1 annotation:"hypothetical protein DAPPUDRAFT_245544"
MVESSEQLVREIQASTTTTKPDLAFAEKRLETAEKKQLAYATSIIECQVLSDLEEGAEDAHEGQALDLEERIAKLAAQVASIRVTLAAVGPIAPPEPRAGGALTNLRGFNFAVLNRIAQDATHKDFREWCNCWENNARVHKLVSFKGTRATKIVKTHHGVNLDEESTTVEGILDQLQAYYRSQQNVTADRVAFHRRKQQPNEPFDSYRFSLADLAEEADLCRHCLDTQMVTQIIVGTNDAKAKHDLLEERKFPWLERTIDVCHASEIASKNQEKLDSSCIQYTSRYKATKHPHLSRGRSKSRERSTGSLVKCQYCGGPSHGRTQCPARSAKCSKCQREDFYDPSDGQYYGQIPHVLPDTGSGAYLMSKRDFRKLGSHEADLQRTHDVLYAANNLEINTKGRADFKIVCGIQELVSTFIITDEYNETLINLKTCRRLRLIPGTFPKPIVTSVTISEPTPESLKQMREDLLLEFEDVFDGDKPLRVMTGPPAHIALSDNATLFHVNGPRPIPIQLRSKAKETVLKREIIEEVTEPTDWLHPSTFIPKKPGSDTLRLCVDLRRLYQFSNSSSLKSSWQKAWDEISPKLCLRRALNFLTASNFQAGVTFDLFGSQLKELGDVEQGGENHHREHIAGDSGPLPPVIDREVVRHGMSHGQVSLEGEDDRHVDGAREAGIVHWVEDIGKEVVVDIQSPMLMADAVEYAEDEVQVVKEGQEDQEPVEDALHTA